MENEKLKNILHDLLIKGEHEKCLRLARTKLQFEPDQVGAKLYEAASLKELGKLNDAIDSFSICLMLDPSFIPAYAYRAECFFDLEKYEEALRDYETIIENDPSFTMAWHLGAIVADFLNMREKAFIYINRAIEDEGRPESYAQKALLFEKAENVREALKYYKIAVRKKLNDKEVLNKIKELENIYKKKLED